MGSPQFPKLPKLQDKLLRDLYRTGTCDPRYRKPYETLQAYGLVGAAHGNRYRWYCTQSGAAYCQADPTTFYALPKPPAQEAEREGLMLCALCEIARHVRGREACPNPTHAVMPTERNTMPIPCDMCEQAHKLGYDACPTCAPELPRPLAHPYAFLLDLLDSLQQHYNERRGADVLTVAVWLALAKRAYEAVGERLALDPRPEDIPLAPERVRALRQEESAEKH